MLFKKLFCFSYIVAFAALFIHDHAHANEEYASFDAHIQNIGERYVHGHELASCDFEPFSSIPVSQVLEHLHNFESSQPSHPFSPDNYDANTTTPKAELYKGYTYLGFANVISHIEKFSAENVFDAIPNRYTSNQCMLYGAQHVMNCISLEGVHARRFAPEGEKTLLEEFGVAFAWNVFTHMTRLHLQYNNPLDFRRNWSNAFSLRNMTPNMSPESAYADARLVMEKSRDALVSAIHNLQTPISEKTEDLMLDYIDSFLQTVLNYGSLPYKHTRSFSYGVSEVLFAKEAIPLFCVKLAQKTITSKQELAPKVTHYLSEIRMYGPLCEVFYTDASGERCPIFDATAACEIIWGDYVFSMPRYKEFLQSFEHAPSDSSNTEII